MVTFLISPSSSTNTDCFYNFVQVIPEWAYCLQWRHDCFHVQISDLFSRVKVTLDAALNQHSELLKVSLNKQHGENLQIKFGIPLCKLVTVLAGWRFCSLAVVAMKAFIFKLS